MDALTCPSGQRILPPHPPGTEGRHARGLQAGTSCSPLARPSTTGARSVHALADTVREFRRPRQQEACDGAVAAARAWCDAPSAANAGKAAAAAKTLARTARIPFAITKSSKAARDAAYVAYATCASIDIDATAAVYAADMYHALKAIRDADLLALLAGAQAECERLTGHVPALPDMARLQRLGELVGTREAEKRAEKRAEHRAANTVTRSVSPSRSSCLSIWARSWDPGPRLRVRNMLSGTAAPLGTVTTVITSSRQAPTCGPELLSVAESDPARTEGP